LRHHHRRARALEHCSLAGTAGMSGAVSFTRVKYWRVQIAIAAATLSRAALFMRI